MPKTIRELADELNVSKQTIQYHYQRLPTKNQQKNSQGTNMISLTAERIIRDKVTKPLVANGQQTGSKENNELIATLRREIEDLKSQRDKQLASKDTQINNLTKLLDQSQQLQLIAENKSEKSKPIASKENIPTRSDRPKHKILKKKTLSKKNYWWPF
ncbi:DUF536 domain-containing protein [Lactiplantibacillus plantarum]|uniref:DUF536 domain-containing protein n=1 Tax=Lactiplantibacillus plantarum TaxID=1590 RepID=UPI0026550719|nr:DUF536 domain-containing protein [Lactiplantibacillus plantarum]MDN7072461.1 DUF536 domain-containing protein [Lactiplantibacillus plantarum]